MAKAKAVEETPVEIPVESVDNGLVEVEYALGEFNTTFYGNGFKAEFVEGKASVTEAIAEQLKELKLIK
jgi:hypothetical protein